MSDADEGKLRLGGMALRRWNDVSPLVRLGGEVTSEPDARVAPR